MKTLRVQRKYDVLKLGKGQVSIMLYIDIGTTRRTMALLNKRGPQLYLPSTEGIASDTSVSA